MVSKTRDLERGGLIGDLHSSKKLVDSPPAKATSDKSCCKILQVEQRFSMLFSIGGLMLVVTWLQVVPLQTMTSTSGEDYAYALKQLTIPVSRTTLEKFSRVQRCTTTDGAGGIRRCEQAYAMDNPKTHCMHLTCVVHNASSSKTRVMQQSGEVVVGLKNLCLSLRNGPSMRDMRGLLRKFIDEHLEINTVDLPSPAQLASNRKLINIWLPEADVSCAMRRSLILGLCTGDWSCRGVLTHHLRSGYCSSVDHARSMFRKEFIAAVVGKGPGEFPTKGWIRSEVAISWCGILASLHGLLGYLYASWCGADVSSVLIVGGAAIDLEQLLEELLDEDAGRGGEEHHDGAAGNTEVIHEAGAAADPIAQYRLELALFKRKALAWMKRGQIAVLADLIEMRTILEPHRKYIQELLMMSGQDWELRQQAKAFDFSTGLSDHGRQYRLLVSASCKLEQEAFDMCMLQLRGSRSWLAIPEICWTEARRSSVFSRIACSLSFCHALKEKHKGYPYKLFTLVESGEHLESIKSDPACVRDSWSQGFVQHYGELLGNAESLADLRATALFVQEDQAAVECGFARVRRSLTFHSVQTHQEHFESCNVHWCAGGFRRRCALRPSGATKRKQCAPDIDEIKRPMKTRRISTWNAFVHQETSGMEKLPDLSRISGRYAELQRDEEAWLKLKEVAIKGTQAVREGARPFGQSSREIQRSHGRAACLSRAICDVALVADGHPASPSGAADALVHFRLPSDVDMNECARDQVQRLQARHRARNQALACEEMLVMQKLDKYCQDGTTKVAIDEIHDMMPSLRDPLRSSQLLPTGVAQFRELLWSPDDVLRRAKEALAMKSNRHAIQLLHRQLTSWWSTMSSTPSLELLTKLGKTKPTNQCLSCGECVCSGAGIQKRAFRASLQRVLRRQFPPGPDRIALQDSRVALLFCGTEMLPPGEVAADAPEEAMPVRHWRWLHIGAIKLNTFDVVFVCLEDEFHCGARMTDDGIVQFERPLLVRCLGQCLTLIAAVGLFDLNLRWEVALLQLSGSSRFVGLFDPSLVSLVAHDDCKLHLVWDPTVKRRKKKATNEELKRHDGWDLLMDECEGPAAGDHAQEAELEDVGGDLLDFGDGHAIDAGLGEMDVHSSASLGSLPDVDMSESSAGSDAACDVVDVADAEAAPDAPLLGPVDEVPVVDVAEEAMPVDPPPLLPPPLVAADLPNRISLDVPGGSIVWYKSHNAFYGTCKGCGHGNCRRTRVATAGSSPQQGRPLGALVAWLANQREAACAFDHKSFVYPGLAARKEGRRALKDLIGIDHIIWQRERAKRAGEDSEPEEHP